jgi:hypothetical protein
VILVTVTVTPIEGGDRYGQQEHHRQHADGAGISRRAHSNKRGISRR